MKKKIELVVLSFFKLIAIGWQKTYNIIRHL